MAITDDMKLWFGITIACVLIIGVGAFFALRADPVYKRSELIHSATVTRGPKDAAVYLVEFSDFQCPACKAFVPIVEKILKTHGDRILFGYRNFPLPQHTYARIAAEAFEAANEQGKGWEMYTYLFANQERFSKEVILNGAKELNLDEALFEKAMTTNTYATKIDEDIAEGTQFGIDSTPTFFLNGEKLKLSSLNDLQNAVENALKISE
jgi:protein-disulfide isomerase